MFDIDEAPQYLSREKYQELEKELEYLKTEKRREIAESLEQAKSFGDLSENAEYEEARASQAKLEERIVRLKSVLKRAVIIESRGTNTVQLGSRVAVVKEGGNDKNDKRELVIVGSEETDLERGKISNESPMGKAMLGKKKGDVFSFDAPKGQARYRITAIE